MNNQELKKLKEKVMQTLNAHLKKNHKIVVGVSGGPDSVFLLHFLLEFQKKIPLKIVVAHLNHQLRKEATSEGRFVENFVKHFLESSKSKNSKKQKNFTNLVLHTKKVDIKALSKKSKIGIEETGRKARYDFFGKLATKYKADFILTAHHADDNLETVILNLTRGASLKGLCGMQETDKLKRGKKSDKKFFTLFRPLLDISKDEIIPYLKAKKIKFIVDKSNFSNIYKRNAIRNRIIPSLKKLNPSLIKTIAKNSKILREVNEFLEGEAEKWIKKNLSFNAESFRKLSPALQKAIILKIYQQKVGDIKNVENAHVEEVLKIINNKVGNKKKKLGKITFFVKNSKTFCCKKL